MATGQSKSNTTSCFSVEAIEKGETLRMVMV